MFRRSLACFFPKATGSTPLVDRFIEESRKKYWAQHPHTPDLKKLEEEQRAIAGLLEARKAFAAGYGVEIPREELDALFDTVERVVPKSDTACEAVSTPETIFGC